MFEALGKYAKLLTFFLFLSRFNYRCKVAFSRRVSNAFIYIPS